MSIKGIDFLIITTHPRFCGISPTCTCTIFNTSSFTVTDMYDMSQHHFLLNSHRKITTSMDNIMNANNRCSFINYSLDNFKHAFIRYWKTFHDAIIKLVHKIKMTQNQVSCCMECLLLKAVVVLF